MKHEKINANDLQNVSHSLLGGNTTYSLFVSNFLGDFLINNMTFCDNSFAKLINGWFCTPWILSQSNRVKSGDLNDHYLSPCSPIHLPRSTVFKYLQHNEVGSILLKFNLWKLSFLPSIYSSKFHYLNFNYLILDLQCSHLLCLFKCRLFPGIVDDLPEIA